MRLRVLERNDRTLMVAVGDCEVATNEACSEMRRLGVVELPAAVLSSWVVGQLRHAGLCAVAGRDAQTIWHYLAQQPLESAGGDGAPDPTRH